MKAGKDFIGVGCGALILDDKNHVLLLKRRGDMSEERTTVGMWSLPGGEVKFGERIEDALKREVKEEIGVDVKIVKYIGYSDQILQSGIHWHGNHFLCRIKKGTPEIMEKKNFDRLQWFSLKEIPEDSGITHVVKPLYLLGLMSEEEYKKRLKTTRES